MSFARNPSAPADPQAALIPFLNEMKQEIASIRTQIDSKRSFEAAVNVLPTVEDLRKALEAAQDDLLAQRAEFFQQRLHDTFEFHAKLKDLQYESMITLERQKRSEAELSADVNARAALKAQERISALESDIQSRTKDLEACQSRVQELSQLCMKQDAQRSSLADRCKQLEKEVDETRKRSEQMMFQARQHALEVTSLNTQLNTQKLEVGRAAGRCDELTKALQDAQNNIGTLTLEREKQDARARDSAAALQAAHDQVESIKVQYNNLHREATKIIQELEVSVQSSQCEVSAARTKRSEAEALVARTQQILQSRDAEITKLKQNLQKCSLSTHEVDRMREEYQKCSKELILQTEKSAELSKRLEEISKQHQTTTAELMTTKQCLEMTIREKRAIQEQLRNKSAAETTQSPSVPKLLASAPVVVRNIDPEQFGRRIQAMRDRIALLTKRIPDAVRDIKTMQDSVLKAIAALTSKSNLNGSLTSPTAPALPARPSVNGSNTISRISRSAGTPTQDEDIADLIKEREILKQRHASEVSSLRTRLAYAEEHAHRRMIEIDDVLVGLRTSVEDLKRSLSSSSPSSSIANTTCEEILKVVSSLMKDRDKVEEQCKVWEQVIAIDLDQDSLDGGALPTTVVTMRQSRDASRRRSKRKRANPSVQPTPLIDIKTEPSPNS